MGSLAWWPHDELMVDPRFRRLDSDGYIDAVAVLSLEEARELASKFRGNDRKLFAIAKARLDTNLRLEAPESCWVLVSVYEWESGL